MNTKAGGQKTKEKILAKYGPNFYKEIGAIGGKLGSGPFRKNIGLARRAGSLGGKYSRRGFKLIRRHGNVCTYKNNTTGLLETIVVE